MHVKKLGQNYKSGVTVKPDAVVVRSEIQERELSERQARAWKALWRRLLARPENKGEKNESNNAAAT